jgi:hypothetical protein
MSPQSFRLSPTRASVGAVAAATWRLRKRFRDRELLLIGVLLPGLLSKEKFVAAGCGDQHARSVRSPECIHALLSF